MARRRLHVAVVLDALFPRFCVGCGREGGILCTPCDEAWVPDGGAALVPSNTQLHYLAHYADPVARGLLTTWKYHFDETAWEILQRRLRPALPLVHLRAALSGVEAIVPVPLSRDRKARRGFDQAERIAAWLSAGIHRPVAHLLTRRFTVGRQAERTMDDRKAAMADSPFTSSAMLMRLPKDMIPARVLLVDDVWTTGATMAAASRTLAMADIASVPFAMLKG